MELSDAKRLTTAYLGLGSNLDDRAANLLRALKALRDAGLRVHALSSIYETEPVDYLDQPDFLNLAVAVRAPRIEPFSLLKLCLDVETRLGRERLIPKGARTIDIDLLLFDGLALDGVRDGVALTLPHPRLHLRRFALAPLAEIAPELRHPVLGRTIKQLLDELDDSAPALIYAG
ncbi:MAG TPA: 2-amino-4-hydroxy-6-hydroxymethyldihydropteridine diphosphokinase [Blastocatellia bacterium]|nr:2-amino-4-hydroxy-6-hydroxymethyldihydropteridine diphosphokinase [Blastocatellia bacterium]